MKKIGILGASGSIGKQTIDILENNQDKFVLTAFSVGKNIDFANYILSKFKTVEIVSVQEEEDINRIDFSNVVFGKKGLEEVATHKSIDVLVTAVVGSIGLVPTYKAIEAKKDIALANKETLVVAGEIIMSLAKKNEVNICPVDSEHSAIFQALHGEQQKDINKLIITASGGSFRDKSFDELKSVTVSEALKHPNWSMGNKITIDSATMFNKGFEVIEAHHLFDIDYEDIEVLLHRESIIHSMVEFEDYSIIAQLGTPDMRLPIQYALTFPKRKEVKNSKPLNLLEIGQLNFEEIDYVKYEGLKLCIEYGKIGNTYPCVLNAANEEANKLFLTDKIAFLDIVKIVKNELKKHKAVKNPDLETLLDIDKMVREKIKKEYK